jgi:hypothetical protein
METAKLTVRLPKDDIEFAKRYARSHRITVTELISSEEPGPIDRTASNRNSPRMSCPSHTRRSNTKRVAAL